MEFSLCTTSRKELPLNQIIKKIVEINFRGIEIWDEHIDDFLKHGSLKDLNKLLNNNNIQCCCIAPYFNFLSEHKAKESIECAKKCIAYAKELNCGVIRTFLGNKPSASLTEHEIFLIVNSLKEIMDYNHESKITFAIETHFDQPSDRTSFILKLLKDVDSPYLKVLFDGFNFYVDDYDMYEEYIDLKEYSVHYHIKNYLWRSQTPTALQDGDVDFRKLIKILKKEDVFMSFEYFCEEQYNLIKRSIKWIKELK